MMKAKKNTIAKDRVCVVIPAYNEATKLRKVVKDVKASLTKAGYACTVVVIDDGSKDATATEAEKGGAIVIKHILNTGVGGATATGLSFAHKNNFRMTATMDADGQHDPKDVARGFGVLEENDTDLLIGSRLINSEGMSKVKVLGNKGLSLITRLLFGVNATDSQSGLRMFSRRSLELLRWETSGYEFCSEMLWRAKQVNLMISEYPIKAIYTDYSQSKGQNNWNAVNIVISLLRRRLTEIFQ